MIPLELTPLYSANSYLNKYWYDTRNTTAWNVFMYELVRGGNAITDLFLQTTLPVLSTAHIGGSYFHHMLHLFCLAHHYASFVRHPRPLR